MKTKALPDQAMLRALLRYDPDTGRLFWRPRHAEMFNAGNRGREANAQAWNARYAEKEAFACEAPIGSRGYVQANLLGEKYLKHRIIWKMVTGEEPPEVDHENGIRSDNRWANLKASDRVSNGKNQAIRVTNRSGATGVFWSTVFHRWQANIFTGGKRIHLGLFSDKDEAIMARKAAERRYGFAPRHGTKRQGVSGKCK